VTRCEFNIGALLIFHGLFNGCFMAALYSGVDAKMGAKPREASNIGAKSFSSYVLTGTPSFELPALVLISLANRAIRNGDTLIKKRV